MIEAYTDGACRGNGSISAIGSYAFLIVENGKIIHSDKMARPYVTSNIMELTAAIAALTYIKQRYPPDTPVLLRSDSLYVVHGVNLWMEKWERTGWKRGLRPMLNAELWQRLYQLTKEVNVNFRWVRGHSNNRYNNLADQLCNQVLNEFQ